MAQIDPKSAAARAGLKSGDIVLKIDGEDVKESEEMPRLIGDKQPGSKVVLEIWRDGKSREITAVLDDDPGTTAKNRDTKNPNARGKVNKLGLRLRALTPPEASRLGIENGVLVEAVSGVATHAGLQRGDVILTLNNQPVTSPAQFVQLIDKAGKRAALLVQRGNARIFIPFKID